MTIFATLTPIDLVSGTRVTVRVCGSADEASTGIAGERWWPALLTMPVIQARFFDGDFSSAVAPATAQMDLRLDVLIAGGAFPGVERYDWAGASCTLQRLSGGSLVDLQLMQVESFASKDMVLALRLAAAGDLFDAEVLQARYAGTTGAEGGADLKGQLKPWVFGRALNVEPVFIDQIDNVFQVSGYGAVQAISAVYERGASFGASVGDFANYAALVAATIPAGRWATCLAQGMFRLGAPPAGVITCDVDGDNVGGFLRRTGEILSNVATRIGLVDKVSAASMSALDAAVPRNVNIVIREQISFMELAQRMLAPCNAVASVGQSGRLIASRVIFGAEQFTLDAQGREMPPVLSMERQNTSAPYKRVQMGAARSWRVHSFDEIAFYSDLIDRGLYSASQVYREGDIVSLIDKSRWLYISQTAASGNAPPTWPVLENAFWANLEPPASEDIAVANRRVLLQGPLDERPIAGDFIGQMFAVVDPADPDAEASTVYRWDGPISGWIIVATEGAILPSPGAAESGSGGLTNLRDHTGRRYDPGELLNTSIVLTPSGRLEYRPLPSSAPVGIGQIALPDLGAASQVALRRAEDDVDALAEALATALDEASRTRQTFTDAGFYSDPATGQVRIHAIEQTRERVSSAEIRLNAAEAQINLRATVNYVDEAILNAVIDPSQIAELETVFLRLTAAEVDIDGLNATVTTLATATELSLVAGRVTTAESAIDALEGTVATKVDTTTFNALETRVTSAESTLTAIGDTASIVNAVRSVRLVEREQDANAEADLRALLQGDRAQRDQVAAIAAARQELRTDIREGDAAEALARLALQVRVGQAEATAATETAARISGDNALATQITALTASLNTETANRVAAINSANQARIDGDALIAAGLAQQATAARVADGEAAGQAEQLLAALLQDDKTRRETNGALAGVRQEITAQIVADKEAFASSLVALVARIAGNEASIIEERQARTSADQSIAQSVTSLNASFTTQLSAETTARIAAIAQEADARQQAVTTLTASIQSEATARADADGALAGQINTLTTTVAGNTATLVTFGESINGLRARQGVRLDVNGRITGYVQNNDGTQGDFIIVADNFRVVDPDTGAAFIDADESGLRLRNGRVIMDNGVYIKATGVGFGTSGQFIEWFGPRPAGGDLALCTEAAALAYLKTNGDAYFGGSLSAGVIRNAARTTDIGAGASITIGPFGTNGNPILVVTSYSALSQDVATYPATSQGLADWNAAVSAWGATPGTTVSASKAISCNVVVRVDRAVGNGSPASWATLTITGGTETLTGQAPTPGDQEGSLTYLRTVSGSITSTDNGGGTQNRTFTATITTRTNAVLGTIISQIVALTATEE